MIKIPNLQFVDIATRDFTTLKKTLIDANIGENPIAIAIDPSLSKNAVSEIVDTLKEVCVKLFINPKIPYPIFVVSNHVINSSDFLFVKNKDDITNYYRLKMKKLKKRESHLLSKVRTYTTRINHYRVGESIDSLKEHSKKHKMLKAACKEKSFYTDIIEKIAEAKKR